MKSPGTFAGEGSSFGKEVLEQHQQVEHLRLDEPGRRGQRRAHRQAAVVGLGNVSISISATSPPIDSPVTQVSLGLPCLRMKYRRSASVSCTASRTA